MGHWEERDGQNSVCEAGSWYVNEAKVMRVDMSQLLGAGGMKRFVSCHAGLGDLEVIRCTIVDGEMSQNECAVVSANRR